MPPLPTPPPARWLRWLAQAKRPSLAAWQPRWQRFWNSSRGMGLAFLALLLAYGIWVLTGMQVLIQQPWLSGR